MKIKQIKLKPLYHIAAIGTVSRNEGSCIKISIHF